MGRSIVSEATLKSGPRWDVSANPSGMSTTIRISPGSWSTRFPAPVFKARFPGFTVSAMRRASAAHPSPSLPNAGFT
jgi:hypothetical protein